MIIESTLTRNHILIERSALSIYISIVFLLSFFDTVFDNINITVLLLLSQLPGVFLFLCQSVKSKSKVLLLITLLLVLTVNSIIHQDLYVKFFYFLVFSLWVVTRLRTEKISIWPILLLLYTLTVYVMFFSLFQGLSVNRIFESGSRNLLSYFSIYLFSFYCLLSYANHKKVQITPVLCVLIICVLGIGRTGILLSMVLFLSWILSRLSMTLTIKKILLGTSLIVLLIVFVFIYSEGVSSVLKQFHLNLARIERYGLSNDYRNNMLDYYLSNLDVVNIFFGYNYTENNYFMKWDLNPHNSFIRLHLYSGMLGLLSFLMLYLFSSYFWFKKSIFMLVVLNVIIIRIYFDTLAFFGPLDFVVFAVILYPFPVRHCNPPTN